MTSLRHLYRGLTSLPVLLLGLCAAAPAHADFELRDADGRRILLKDDGSWRYVDAAPAAAAASAPAAEPAPPPLQAEMQLLRRTELSAGCGFTLTLSNTLPYAIQSLVPEFAVHRDTGVVYTTQSLGFGPVKPGDLHQRELIVLGLSCGEISRLQVQGGDRCDMGQLNKFSDAKGECLERLKVLPSALITIEK